MTRLIGKLFALATLSNSLSQSVSVFDIYNKPAQQKENTAVFKVGKNFLRISHKLKSDFIC